MFYICNMETTQNIVDQKGHRLAIKANQARIELLEYELATRNDLTQTRMMSIRKQIAICEVACSRSEASLIKLLRDNIDFQFFLIEYRSLTDKIRIFESILQSENSFENSKNVKKYRKRRKQLKNAYLKANYIEVSDLNEMIENGLKTA